MLQLKQLRGGIKLEGKRVGRVHSGCVHSVSHQLASFPQRGGCALRGAETQTVRGSTSKEEEDTLAPPPAPELNAILEPQEGKPTTRHYHSADLNADKLLRSCLC